MENKKLKSKKFNHEKVDIGYDDLDTTTTNSGRDYLTPDGSLYPSVTTVLSILNEDIIKAWRKRVGEEEANRISGKASNRGTRVHSIVEKYLNNEDTVKFLPHIRQSLENLKPVLNNIETIYGLEVPLYSHYLGLAGRCDCIGKYNGVPSIIDFKTSRYIKKKEKISNYFAQGAAYSIMWEERTGLVAPNIVIIMDVDHEKPLVFVEHRDNWTKLLTETIEEYKKRKLFGH
ncbi:MAG: exonuclease [Gammaproteobacteria bacterium]|nr:exonuclease [Gammaproteobacteria bacterium]|tara:strand:+ start:758 stop:1450 length:693 start_codon:yes stop_codon:yes gene_type:complete